MTAMNGGHVGVLGGGPWGVALCRAARRAGSQITLLSRRHEANSIGGVSITTEYEVLAEAPLILVAVPSQQVQTVARRLGEHLSGAHRLVHGIRGLGTGDRWTTISEIFREETPVRRLGALGGPVQANELNEGRPSALVVGSCFADVREAVRMALESDGLQVHSTADLIGLEWASALVGCLSIGVGYAQARTDISPGLLAALISAAVDEASAIAVEAGAQEMTLYGLAGYGDLLASMALTDRPEVILGRELAGGANLAQARERARLRVEAVELVPKIARYAEGRGIRCHLFQALANILQGREKPEALIGALFARRLTPSS